MQFLHISVVILSQSFLSPAHRPSLRPLSPLRPLPRGRSLPSAPSVCLALRRWPDAAAAAAPPALPSLCPASVFLFF